VSNAAAGTRELRAALFRDFVEPEIDVLLRVAQTLTGSWADAEDLVQETLIRAYRGIDRFDGAHPRAWLLTILRNTNLNAQRRQRPELLDGACEDLDRHRRAFGASAAPSPEDTVTGQILDADLQRAVDGLDPRFRTVLLLIDVDQLSYAEVGQALGVPIGTVMSRLSRARNRVRDQLRTPQQSGRNR
jgi:RNA polymerase sigma-70 factor (ECF subfamily)